MEVWKVAITCHYVSGNWLRVYWGKFYEIIFPLFDNNHIDWQFYGSFGRVEYDLYRVFDIITGDMNVQNDSI